MNNGHIQILGIGHTYTGSLINVVSDIPEAFFGFSRNRLQHNWFVGEETRLVNIDGPLMSVEANELENNGWLQAGPAAVNATKALDDWYATISSQGINPYTAYLHSNSQKNGVFGLVFEQHEIALGRYHLFRGNYFTHNFCYQGCSYYIKGDKAQQLLFESNTYRN